MFSSIFIRYPSSDLYTYNDELYFNINSYFYYDSTYGYIVTSIEIPYYIRNYIFRFRCLIILMDKYELSNDYPATKF
jgi:hypothetical protein